MIEIEILKTKTCPYCAPATELVKKIAKDYDNVKVVETFLETPEGQKKALSLGVMSVPTILLNGNIFSVGIPEENSLREAIEKSEKNK